MKPGARGVLSTHQKVEEHTESVNVCRRRHWTGCNLLRGGKGRGQRGTDFLSQQCRGAFPSLTFEKFGDTEIQKLDLAIFADQHIRRLDVAMDDQVGMRVRDRAEHLK